MHRAILKYLQIENNGLARQEAQALWEEAQTLLAPAAWQCRLSADQFWTRFAPHARASQALGRLLAGCTQVVLLVATLGQPLERRAQSYLERREAFRGYILDRMGSFLVENRMRQLDRQVNAQARAQGLVPTRRYSPGYQDFSLEAQGVFVELAAQEMPGLGLSPGGLLQPEKTITALKGLSPMCEQSHARR